MRVLELYRSVDPSSGIAAAVHYIPMSHIVRPGSHFGKRPPRLEPRQYHGSACWSHPSTKLANPLPFFVGWYCDNPKKSSRPHLPQVIRLVQNTFMYKIYRKIKCHHLLSRHTEALLRTARMFGGSHLGNTRVSFHRGVVSMIHT
jgi:hypothetical protein